MDFSVELYSRNNDMQKSGSRDVLIKYIDQIKWKPNEIVLDIGCGSGNVTVDILYHFFKNNIKQLIGVDKKREMVEYSKKTYDMYPKINFDVLDIGNTIDCHFYSHKFDKIFSFFCMHLVSNKLGAAVNMHSMLKNNGEILIHTLMMDPVYEIYKCLDAEWKKYRDKIEMTWENLNPFHTGDEVKTVFTKAGFKNVSVEHNIVKYIFPDCSSMLDAIQAIDQMYNILPPHLHEKYSMHVKDKICEYPFVVLCPTTGAAAFTYNTCTVHAIKD